MLYSRNFLSEKYKYQFSLTALLFVAIICVAFSTNDNENFESAKREVLLRSIGHELLLQSGDSTSRVLPVKKIAENEYEIQFEKEFSFRPENLVKTIERLLSKDSLATDYIVTVVNTQNSSVVYGYTISKDKKDDNIPCLGRIQPKAHYNVNIKFKTSGINGAENGYLLPILAIAGIVIFRSVKSRKSFSSNKHSDLFVLGKIQFDEKNRKLLIDGKTIDLTATESRLLHIFAITPNKTIERNRLQKEIWEDEGVIVGRSLDMFISKLRKKLEVDSNVNIVVVRGKGYKLEINS